MPADHPIRAVKRLLGEMLEGRSAHFDGIYAAAGRPPVPPETLLEGRVLQAFSTIRSDRPLKARLQTDLLFRCFVDPPLNRAAADASSYSKNQERLLAHEVATPPFRRRWSWLATIAAFPAITSTSMASSSKRWPR